MTKQQLLALLREAYNEGKREQSDADWFINDVVSANRVGDLELPELGEWPDESRIDAIGQNGGDYSLVPHEFYD